MATPKDVRRSLPRVSYEQRIRLLGEDGKPLIVGRTMNLSPSGIYVRAPNGCEIGSEVTCDLPLPGGTRQLRGRVTRTEAHPDESTGIGIQFVDLTTGDSSSLHRVLEGGAARPVAVKVMFEGMNKPIKCHGTVTADGIRLSTALPFLRLGSDVKAVYDGQGAQDLKIETRGVLTGVRLEPVGGDGVPRLGVDVDIESEKAFDPSAARTPALSREDASVGGAFTAWEGGSAGGVRRSEPAVIAELGAETEEVTAVRSRPVARPAARSTARKLVARVAALSGSAFVIVAIGTFGLVYVAITRLGPGIDESRRPEIAGGVGEAGPPPLAARALKRPPLVVPSSVPAPRREGEGAPEAGGTKHDGAPVSTPAATMTATADGGKAAARAGTRGRLRPRTSQDPASTSARSSPFPLNDNNGRHELRAGASIDTKGEPSIGPGGIAAAADGKDTNMRELNVAVESGVLYHEVSLPHPEADGRFGVRVTPSWPTTFAIVGKSPAGFTVSFGTPAPANAHLDWFLVR